MADLTPRATGRNSKFEAKLLKKYPPIFAPTIYEMRPCSVQDEEGNILLWYLPGAITTRRAVSRYPYFFFRWYPLFTDGIVANVGRLENSGEVASHRQGMQELACCTHLFQSRQRVAEAWKRQHGSSLVSTSS